MKGIRVFLNPRCHYGTGLPRWRKVKRELRRRLGDFQIELIGSADQLAVQVSKCIEKGDDRLVVAGGDGTVNLLVTAVMASDEVRSRAIIGAVGLGSSNDFHKPFRREALVKGVPLRIDFDNATFYDVIRIDYDDVDGNRRVRFCIVNASIGVVAEANAIYRSRGPFIAGVRTLSKSAAVVLSAVSAILTYGDLNCSVSADNEEPRNLSLTNLAAIKNPHIAGAFCYDTPIRPDDGKIRVNACIGLSAPERISMLIALGRHRFQGRPKTMSRMATRLSLEGNRPFALEIDGEVTHAKACQFTIIPKAVRCCQ
jgi:diacylglycerol kinase family enzyme